MFWTCEIALCSCAKNNLTMPKPLCQSSSPGRASLQLPIAVVPSSLQVRKDAAAEFGQWGSQAFPPFPVACMSESHLGRESRARHQGWMQCHHLGAEVHAAGSRYVPLGLAELERSCAQPPGRGLLPQCLWQSSVCEQLLISSRHNQVA